MKPVLYNKSFLLRHELGAHEDVNIVDPQTNQVLQWSGEYWYNSWMEAPEITPGSNGQYIGTVAGAVTWTDIKLLAGGGSLPYANSAAARTALDVYSKGEVDTAVDAAGQPLYTGQPDLPYASATAVRTAISVPPISRTINTTSPLTGGGDLSVDRTLSMPAASGSVDGYLSASDWTTFNGKFATPTGVTAGNIPRWTGAGFADSGLARTSTYTNVLTYLRFDNATNPSGYGIGKSSTELRIQAGSGGSVGLGINGNYIATLTDNGVYQGLGIGLGTDTVTAPLHVRGNLNEQLRLEYVSGVATALQVDNSGNFFIIPTGSKIGVGKYLQFTATSVPAVTEFATGAHLTNGYYLQVPTGYGWLFRVGSSNHIITDATSFGIFGVTPASRPSAYTQTYSTVARTVTALLVDGSGGTPGGTVSTISDANTANAIASILVQLADIKKVQNAMIDDHQGYGWFQ